MEASILTIDDSLPLHRLMKSIFDSQGVTFHSAYDGERGLAMAAHIHPDVILLDVDLPEMDGFEVCERLKNSQETSPIPVIFLTAGIASSDQAKGFGVGAADYITKPFVAEDLIASISSQLRNRKTEQRPVADRILSMQDRESLDEFVASQCNLASQRGQPMACISCDVDELRIINSRQGRATGDEVLRRVGQTLLGNSRNGETVVDCGGGKFVVVAPGLNRRGAGRMAHKLCDEMQNLRIVGPQIKTEITCTFGVADDAITAAGVSLLDRADGALTKAKLNGKGCVSIARPPR